MAFKFLHVGKAAVKFDFVISSVDVEQSSLAGKLLSLRCSRGSRKAASSRNVVADAAGHACWADDVLKFTATLYRSDSHSKFDSKEYKISVEEVVRSSATKSAGSVKFDIAKYANSVLTSSQSRLDLNLEKGSVGGRVQLVLKSWPTDSGPRDNHPSSSDLSSRTSFDRTEHSNHSQPTSSARNSQEKTENAARRTPQPPSSSSSSLKDVAQPASLSGTSEVDNGSLPLRGRSNGSSDDLVDVATSRGLRTDAATVKGQSNGAPGDNNNSPLPKARQSPLAPKRSQHAAEDEEVQPKPREREPYRGREREEARDSQTEGGGGKGPRRNSVEGGEAHGGAMGGGERHLSAQRKAGTGEEKREGGRMRGGGDGDVAGMRGAWSVGRREKEHVKEMVGRALRAVEEQERVLAQLTAQKDEDTFACDVSLLLESCIYNLPLPPDDSPRRPSTSHIQTNGLHRLPEGQAPSETGTSEQGEAADGAWARGAPAWVVGQFMLHHGVLTSPKAPKRAAEASASVGVEGARREMFIGRLVAAVEGACGRSEAAGAAGRWLLTNVVLLRELVGAYAAGEGAGRGGAGLRELWQGLDRGAQGLYGRVAEAERREMRRVGKEVLAAAAAGSAPGAAVERAVGEVERALETMAVRMKGQEVLSWVGRGVMEAGVTALDLALADGLGGGEEWEAGSGLCCFEGALVVKEVIGRVERWARRHILQGRWAEGAGEVRVGLALARQSADVVMLEKSLLTGDGSAEFQSQICPDLSRLRISRLVSRFQPDPSAPDRVPPALLAELSAQAEEEEARRRRGGGHVGNGSVRARVGKGIPPPLTDEREAVRVLVDHVVAGRLAGGDGALPLLQGRPSLSFLWPVRDTVTR